MITMAATSTVLLQVGCRLMEPHFMFLRRALTGVFDFNNYSNLSKFFTEQSFFVVAINDNNCLDCSAQKL
jgi:hypothetical protein